MIVNICLSILFIVLAVIFLMGKGDMLIAGYNTASKEERQKVNIKRLRLLMALMMVITAGFCILLTYIDKNSPMAMKATYIFLAITLVFLICANTWAKKK